MGESSFVFCEMKRMIEPLRRALALIKQVSILQSYRMEERVSTMHIKRQTILPKIELFVNHVLIGKLRSQARTFGHMSGVMN